MSASAPFVVPEMAQTARELGLKNLALVPALVPSRGACRGYTGGVPFFLFFFFGLPACFRSGAGCLPYSGYENTAFLRVFTIASVVVCFPKCYETSPVHLVRQSFGCGLNCAECCRSRNEPGKRSVTLLSQSVSRGSENTHKSKNAAFYCKMVNAQAHEPQNQEGIPQVCDHSSCQGNAIAFTKRNLLRTMSWCVE